MSSRENGTVKWFDNAKGYGFILREDTGEDVFVHFRSIRGEGYKSLDEGQPVEYTLLESNKGWQADEVEKVA